MMNHRVLVLAAALALSASILPSFAQSYGGDTSRPSGSMTAKEDCDQLEGTARSACLERVAPPQRTPFRSPEPASRRGPPPDAAYPPSGAGPSVAPRDQGPQN